MMIHLASMRYRGVPDDDDANAFPFSVPVVQHPTGIEFAHPVTFFVGENGSGKSTVLEALAAATHSITAGSDPVERDPTLARQRVLGGQLDLHWAHRTPSGFFLRAEDFFGFARHTARLREAMRRETEEIETAYQAQGRSDWARTLAKASWRSSRRDSGRAACI